MELGGSGAVERPLPEHVKLGSAVHAALDELQPIHLPFDVALRMSGQLHPMTWTMHNPLLSPTRFIPCLVAPLSL